MRAMRDAAESPAGTAARRALAVLLALLAAGGGWFLWKAALAGRFAQASDIALIAVLALAVVGLAGVVLWLLGWVEFGNLERQRRAYEAILDACGDAYLVTTRSGRPLFANRPYVELLRRAGRRRLVGVDLLFAGQPEVAERIYRLSLHARDGEVAEDEFRLPLPGGKRKESGEGTDAGEDGAGDGEEHVWMRVSVAPAGEDRILWRLEDTTEERRRHDEAWHDLQRMIDQLDNAPAGFLSFAADGRVLYMNATLAGWLGLDLRRSAEGSLHVTDVIPEELALRLQAIRPRPGSSVVEHFLADLRSADGRPLPVQVVHRADFDATGRPRPARTVFVALQGDRLQEAVEPLRLTRFMSAAPIGIAFVDREGRINLMNAALAQITSRARIGGSVEDLIVADDVPKFRAAFNVVAEGRQAQTQVDVRIDSGTDTRAQVNIAATASDEDGQVTGITIYVIDTTLHQALMQELKQGQKMQAMGQMASGIAHDFNNLLTAILGNAEMLLQRFTPADPHFEEIMGIKNQAARAARLVRQLLAYSRKQTLMPEVVSLTELISDMVSMLRRMIGEKVELVLEHGRDLWPVKVDASQMDQVIMNLVVNARDAMPEGGRLVIRTRNVPAEEAADVAPDIMPPADYVLIEVEDTGTGMPPEVLDRIFDPFFTTKKVGKGTGMGLSTVYGIVKQTGGYIFCESELGKGTVFRIYLPRHVETEEERARRLAAQTRKREEPREDLSGSERILLVEDETAVRQLAMTALRQRGYEVHEAPNAEVALDMAAEMIRQGRPPDLVVSDVVMPGMDGPTMMKEMRKLGITAPFIFMSGHAEDAFAESLDRSAEFTFLAKPFSLKQIAESVKKVIEEEKQKRKG
jgi:two-component system cell cycle sensor histidine kinase/response regulator CckA